MDGIIQKCTDKDPKNRFGNCDEIKKALLNPDQIQLPTQASETPKETKTNTKIVLDSDQTRIEHSKPKILNSISEAVSNPTIEKDSTPPNTPPPGQTGFQNAATPPPNKGKSKLALILSIVFGSLLLISGGLYYFLEYEPKHRDSDHDGWADVGDDCPFVYSPSNRGCPDSDNDGVIDIEDKCYTLPGKIENSGCPTSWRNANGSGFVEKGNDDIWREGPGPEPRFQWREVKWSHDSCFFESVDRPGYLMILTKEKFLFKYNKKDPSWLKLASGSWK
jgi:serine/threonine protein kinase